MLDNIIILYAHFVCSTFCMLGIAAVCCRLPLTQLLQKVQKCHEKQLTSWTQAEPAMLKAMPCLHFCVTLRLHTAFRSIDV